MPLEIKKELYIKDYKDLMYIMYFLLKNIEVFFETEILLRLLLKMFSKQSFHLFRRNLHQF